MAQDCISVTLHLLLLLRLIGRPRGVAKLDSGNGGGVAEVHCLLGGV